MPRAARTAQNAVRVEVIEGKLRAMRNETLRKIDCQLSLLGMYEKVCLSYFFTDLVCWERHKAIRGFHLGLPSGTIEHWSWMLASLKCTCLSSLLGCKSLLLVTGHHLYLVRNGKGDVYG